MNTAGIKAIRNGHDANRTPAVMRLISSTRKSASLDSAACMSAAMQKAARRAKANPKKRRIIVLV